MNIEESSNKNPLILRVIGLGKKYFVKNPWWLKKIYPQRTWNISTREKHLYLSFDDGPHPVMTPFVLDELKKYNARASFFCIGENVELYPSIYKRILDEGHSTGNHTFHHLNGWQTPNDTYLSGIAEAGKFIHSRLFRPPYGKIRSAQARKIPMAMGSKTAKIIMWDVLSGDFDPDISAEQCLKNVTRHAGPGSIVVFHDSEKTAAKLRVVLPEVLKFFAEKGYFFRSLENFKNP